MTYRAEFEDDEMEVFEADTHEKAVPEAYKFEKEHGDLFNVTALDEDYNEIETIF